MKINQLLDEIDLPKRYFSEAFIIGEKFEEEASKYLTLLDNCDECDLDADKKAEFNEKLNESKRVAAEISTKIIAVFESYEESNYKVSQELFDEVMEILRPALFISLMNGRILVSAGEKTICTCMRLFGSSNGGRYFRIRAVDGRSQTIKSNPNELFHIPINKRAYTSSERFSLGGFPSLYLSTVLPLAWQECGYPQKYYYSEYQYDKMTNETRNYEDELKFFALYSPKEIYEWGISMKLNDFEVWLEFVIRYLILYPLVLGCSFVNHGGKVSYKQEYIIPQMLMQWVQRNNEIVQGVSYFTCLDIEMMPKEYCGYNLAIPIMKPYDEKNYSERLRKEFIWTMPKYYQIPLLDLKQNKEDRKLLYDFIEEIHKICRSYIIPERIREYINEIERICVCLYQIMKNGNDSNIQMIIHTLNLIDTSCDQLRQQSFEDIVQKIQKKDKKMSKRILKKLIEESKRCVERFWNADKECEGIGYIIEKYSHTTWNDFAQLSIIKILYRCL